MVTAPREDSVQLAMQVQHLSHYLSAAEPVKPGEDPRLIHPADMASYGFNSAREVLDMCSAVGISFPLCDTQLTLDS